VSSRTAREFHGLPLSNPGIDGLIHWLLLPTDRFRVAAYLNAHTFNLAYAPDSELRQLFEQVDMLYPDGESVVRAARRKGMAMKERVSAADFFLRFCDAAAAAQTRIALVGGAGNLAADCAAALKTKIPSLPVVHTQSGYGVDPEALSRVLAEKRALLVLLGMGSPQQERLAFELRRHGYTGTVWCVGALFEYFTPGVRRHAPLWMRRNGLEWLFRLSQEPTRLAHRYLIGNLLFLWRTR
jgi:N-acetylglucosaminyldiphosphoundecaprenol N-acetyl-beta-D-mannosaminyltransferase